MSTAVDASSVSVVSIPATITVRRIVTGRVELRTRSPEASATMSSDEEATPYVPVVTHRTYV